MTAILMMKILTRRVPQSATLVQSCSFIPSQFITTDLACSFQRPRESYCRGFTDGARTFVEIRSGEDVSHRLRLQYN